MRKLFILFACVMSILVHAQVDSTYANTDISLITCEAGDEIYSRFGHTCIRVHNRDTNKDIVYNYGTFDTNTPYFIPKFLRGKLPYKLSTSTYAALLYVYNHEQRSILDQELNLTNAQKATLVKALEENALPENCTYSYDFFFDNCTTRAIDKIANATGTITYNTPIKNITFRSMLKENLTAIPWYAFGIDLIIGARADKITTRENQHFLPMYLYRDIDNATANDNSMVKNDHLVLDFSDEAQRRKSNAPNYPLYVAMILLLIELSLFLFIKNTFTRVWDKIWMILMSLAGLIMAFMWWGTDHLATKNNYNLLWANILFTPYLFTNKKARRVLTICIISMNAIAVINALFQVLPQYFHPAFGCFAMINILKLIRSTFLKTQIA